MKKAVMVFSALGDIAALLPYLKKMSPAPLIITSPVGKEFLKEEFDDFLVLPTKKLIDVLRLILSIRRARLDELIDFQCNDRSRFIAKLSNAGKVVNNDGIDTNQEVHAVLEAMSRRAGIDLDFGFDELPSKRPRTYIVLNAGSSPKWQSKR